MEYHYKTKGTCSRRIDGIGGRPDQDGQISRRLQRKFTGITALIQGAPALEIIRKCKGIQCGMRGTSCRISLPMRWRRLWPLRNYRKRLEQIKILFKRDNGIEWGKGASAPVSCLRL